MQTERPLEIGEHVVGIFGRVVHGDDAIGLNRCAGVTGVADGNRDFPRGLGERALGISIAERAVAKLAFPETIAQKLYRFGPITISLAQIFILTVALALMVLLWLFIERSKTGRAIRATAENHETAALLGVDVNRVVLITFIIGSGIACVAGVLDGIKNSAISPFMGLSAAVKGLIVMLLGGLGNVPGAMIAGLMLGMIEILSAAYIGTTERDFFSFLILILILLWRPTGLFGTRTAEQR